MNVVKEIERLNLRELELGITGSASWHAKYSDSAYVFIGGLDYGLTEGDIIVIFSQFGEVVDCNLVRDKEDGKSRGFCFLAYEDQRSTILAIDNMNGSKVLNRTLRVDHAGKYRRPKGQKKDEKSDNGDPVFEEDDDEEYDKRRKRIWDYELYNAYEEAEVMDEDSEQAAPAAIQAKPKDENDRHADRVMKMLADRKAQRAQAAREGGTMFGAPMDQSFQQQQQPAADEKTKEKKKKEKKEEKEKKREEGEEGKEGKER